MLPMMCIQLACMNMEVSSVIQAMAVHDADGDGGPDPDEAVAVGQLLREHPGR